jgi:hypothetical protein
MILLLPRHLTTLTQISQIQPRPVQVDKKNDLKNMITEPEIVKLILSATLPLSSIILAIIIFFLGLYKSTKRLRGNIEKSVKVEEGGVSYHSF